MGMPGPFELIIILVIVLLIFGGKRLKNIGSELGGAIKGFKSSVKEVKMIKMIKMIKMTSLKLKLKRQMMILLTNKSLSFLF